jgi:small subunit ribosomal protein S3Ae
MAKAVIQKNWYEIQAPEFLSKDEVEETPAEKDSQVLGRTISEDLTELLEGTSKYYVDVQLKVNEVEGSKAFTEVKGMECSKEFVSRMIRKRSDRLDLVHDTTTGDDRTVRVKIVGATVSNTSSKTLKATRQELKEVIDEEASDSDYHEFMEAIFRDELQENLRDAANDIYPFRDLEVRKTELLE